MVFAPLVAVTAKVLIGQDQSSCRCTGARRWLSTFLSFAGQRRPTHTRSPSGV